VQILQTVTDYVLEVLSAEGELDVARRRHAEHYLDVAATLIPQLRTGNQWQAHQRLADEVDNFNAALTWLLPEDGTVPDRARLGLRLCAALSQFWEVEAAPQISSRWYKKALAAGVGEDSRERACVLLALAGDWEWDYRTEDDRGELVEESLGISRRLDDPSGISMALSDLAALELGRGRPHEALPFVEESEELARRSSDPVALSWALVRRAELEEGRGNEEAAIAACEQMQVLALARGDEGAVRWGEMRIAQAMLTAGHGQQAVARLREVSAAVARVPSRTMVINLLATWVRALTQVGRGERAAVVLGAHWAQITLTGGVLDMAEEEEWVREMGLDAERQRLGTDEWDRAIESGRALTLEEALAYAAADA
jgi:hypothetical protein